MGNGGNVGVRESSGGYTGVSAKEDDPSYKPTPTRGRSPRGASKRSGASSAEPVSSPRSGFSPRCFERRPLQPVGDGQYQAGVDERAISHRGGCCASSGWPGTVALVLLSFTVGCVAAASVLARRELGQTFHTFVVAPAVETYQTFRTQDRHPHEQLVVATPGHEATAAFAKQQPLKDVDLQPEQRQALEVDRLYCHSLLASEEDEGAAKAQHGGPGAPGESRQLLLAQLRHGVREVQTLEARMQETKARLQEKAEEIAAREASDERSALSRARLERELREGKRERARLEGKLKAAAADLNSTLEEDHRLARQIESQHGRIEQLAGFLDADGNSSAAASHLRASQRSQFDREAQALAAAAERGSKVTEASVRQVAAVREQLRREAEEAAALRRQKREREGRTQELLVAIQDVNAERARLDDKLRTAAEQLRVQLAEEQHLVSFVRENQRQKAGLLDKLAAEVDAKKALQDSVHDLKERLKEEIRRGEARKEREESQSERLAAEGEKLAAEASRNVELRHQVDTLEAYERLQGLGPGRPREPAVPGKRWAFVMMSYDPPGRPADQLWGVLAMARALQKLSDYPLVILTNSTEFPDGTPVKRGLRALNVEVLPVKKVPPPRGTHFAFEAWNIAWWKIQIWNLTQYDKLIWFDSDSILYRSVDWLFERPGVWAQRDDWFCRLNQAKVCSGIMLLTPNRADYDGILKFGETADLSHGDQQVIAQYYSDHVGEPIQLLSDLEATFGQCIGAARTPYLNRDHSIVRGSWSMPSFVHKSGGWGNTNNNEYNNACFSHRLERQLYRVGNATINVCQYHPLGAYWRGLFCEGAALAGVRVDKVRAYCSDRCWYRGLDFDEADPANELCRPYGRFNATLAEDDYVARLAGVPVDEFRMHPERSRAALVHERNLHH